MIGTRALNHIRSKIPIHQICMDCHDYYYETHLNNVCTGYQESAADKQTTDVEGGGIGQTDPHPDRQVRDVTHGDYETTPY